MSGLRDRAAVVARAIRRILADISDPDERDKQIEQLVREEFDDIRREMASDLASKT